MLPVGNRSKNKDTAGIRVYSHARIPSNTKRERKLSGLLRKRQRKTAAEKHD